MDFMQVLGKHVRPQACYSVLGKSCAAGGGGRSIDKMALDTKWPLARRVVIVGRSAQLLNRRMFWHLTSYNSVISAKSWCRVSSREPPQLSYPVAHHAKPLFTHSPRDQL